jgi:hypothetical protein
MILSFHAKEYIQMRFDPTKVQGGEDILKFYKDLGKIKEFRANPGEDLDNTKVMQYVMCMYDAHSPYRTKFTDVLKRKIEVAHDCEFKTGEGGVFDSVVEDFLKGKNEIVNRKIVQYVMLHRSYKYSYQISIESAYFNLMLEVQSGVTDSKSLAKLAELRDELENNLMELLGQDNNSYVKDTMLKYLEDERLQLRPEDIARKIQNGEKPI